jgi:hypothetical protein
VSVALSHWWHRNIVEPGKLPLLLSRSPWHGVAAVLIGAGTSLMLDEFALILRLQDVYWGTEGRVSVEMVSLASGCLGFSLVGLAPFGVDRMGSQELAVRSGAIVATLVTLTLVVVCVAKGKLKMALFGMFVPVLAWVGAARLGPPEVALGEALRLGVSRRSRAAYRRVRRSLGPVPRPDQRPHRRQADDGRWSSSSTRPIRVTNILTPQRCSVADVGTGGAPSCATRPRRRWMTRRMMIAALPLAPSSLAACGSDKESPSTMPAATTTIGGQQAPNAGGNNNNSGGQDPQSNSVPGSSAGTTPGAGSTADTRDKIGDQSPGATGMP